VNQPVQEEFPLSFLIAGKVYREIRLESYSFGDAFNEEAHRHGIFRHEQRACYDALKEEARKFCDERDPFLTLFAWVRPRNNHKQERQPYPLGHRTRLKPGIETEPLEL
jgi:hypothetical protein